MAAMRIHAQVGHEVVDVTVVRADGRYIVTVAGVERIVDARKLEGDFYSLVMDGQSFEVSVEPDGTSYRVRRGAAEQVVRLAAPAARVRRPHGAGDGPTRVVSVMPGKVVRLLVVEGQHVEDGQGLVVVEAMKMENEIGAPRAGRVTSVAVAPGRAVDAGETLVVIE
jgi:biotin carboxyl carrier protein